MFKLIVTTLGVLSMVSASVYALVVDANSRGCSFIRVEAVRKAPDKKGEELTESEEEMLIQALMGDSGVSNALKKIAGEKQAEGEVSSSASQDVSGGVDAAGGVVAASEKPLAVLKPPESGTSGSGFASGDGEVSDEELRKIEKMMEKQRREAYKRLFTVARRARLNGEQREILRNAADDLWRQIEAYYEQFKYSERTDYDKQVLRQNIGMAYRTTMQDLRYQLGDDAFKRFMTENRYYKNPEERMVDMQKKMYEMDKQMDKQQKQLRGIERTFKRRPRWSRPPSGRSGRRQPSGRRR